MDQLCQQILVQCILSNFDAIKFDNFFVDEAKRQIVHFDFGDAGHDEKNSPDVLTIMDTIRSYTDKSSTPSVKKIFSIDNFTYSAALKFFARHINPGHILAVAQKLEKVPEQLLWQVAYVYSYGDHREKKDYADSLVARMGNFLKLKEAIQSLPQEVKDFSSKQIRNILAESPFFVINQDDHNIMQALDVMFAGIADIKELLISDSEESKSSSSESESSSEEEDSEDIRFEESVDERGGCVIFANSSESNSEQESQSQQSTTSYTESEEEESEEQGSSYGESATVSESEAGLVSESDFEDIAEEQMIRLSEDASNVRKLCTELIEKLPSVQDGAAQAQLQLLNELRQRIKAFHNNIVALASSKQETKYQEDEFDAYIATQRHDMNRLLLSALTYDSAKKTLEEVREKNYAYDPERNEVMAAKFRELGINTDSAPTPELLATLSRIKIDLPRVDSAQASGGRY